jgi:hypothetical protein
LSSSDVLASFDPASYAWKTSQGSLFMDSPLSSGDWPRSGMTRNGRLYAHRMLAHRTAGSGCLSSPIVWPTASAHKTTRSGEIVTADGQPWEGVGKPHSATTGKQIQTALSDAVQNWPTRKDWPTATSGDAQSSGNRNLPGSKAHQGTSLTDAARLWPTARAEDSESSGRRHGRETSDTLTAATRDWLTPATSDNNGVRELDGKRSGGLNTQVDEAANWLTPQTRDHKGVSQKLAKGEYTGGLPDQLAGLADQANPNTTGNPPVPSPRPVLNPRWVLCLMGYPSNYLDGVEAPSKRSATRSCRNVPKSSRGACGNC